jgi:hypothetical protein
VSGPPLDHDPVGAGAGASSSVVVVVVVVRYTYRGDASDQREILVTKTLSLPPPHASSSRSLSQPRSCGRVDALDPSDRLPHIMPPPPPSAVLCTVPSLASFLCPSPSTSPPRVRPHCRSFLSRSVRCSRSLDCGRGSTSRPRLHEWCLTRVIRTRGLELSSSLDLSYIGTCDSTTEHA